MTSHTENPFEPLATIGNEGTEAKKIEEKPAQETEEKSDEKNEAEKDNLSPSLQKIPDLGKKKSWVDAGLEIITQGKEIFEHAIDEMKHRELLSPDPEVDEKELEKLEEEQNKKSPDRKEPHLNVDTHKNKTTEHPKEGKSFFEMSKEFVGKGLEIVENFIDKIHDISDVQNTPLPKMPDSADHLESPYGATTPLSAVAGDMKAVENNKS